MSADICVRSSNSWGRARSEPLDDLPGTLIFFVGVGASEVEVQLVGVHFGEELAATGEVFQIKELVFFEAMHGFHVALVGMGGGRDAHVLAVAESTREIPFKFATVAPRERSGFLVIEGSIGMAGGSEATGSHANGSWSARWSPVP